MFGDVIGKQRFAGAEGLRRQLHDRDTLSGFLKGCSLEGSLSSISWISMARLIGKEVLCRNNI